eukprot:jgi/Galph1/935/GphlegSOOS_G5707.1
MTLKRLSLKYAHTPGKTDLAVLCRKDKECSIILTCGSDATVRAFEWRHHEQKLANFPRKFQITYPHRDEIYSLSVNPETSKLITGDNEGYLRFFSLSEDEAKFESILTRHSGPIGCCAFSSGGGFVFAGGQEPGVVIIVDISSNQIRRISENAPSEAMKDIVVDPLGDYFVCRGERGAISVWSVDHEACIATVCSNGTFAAWKPDGSLIAVSTRNNHIVFVERRSWQIQRTIPVVLDSIPFKVSCMAWTSHPEYILCGGEDGNVLLLSVKSHAAVIARWNGDENSIERIVWHPMQKCFAVVDSGGQLATVNEVPMEDTTPDSEAVTSRREKYETQDEEFHKYHEVKAVKVNAVSDTLDDTDKGNSNHDDDIVPADDISLSSGERSYLPEGEEKNGNPRQSFMPSSTPFNNSNCILCWNRMGLLLSRDAQTHQSIEVEFSDASLKPLRFTDHYGFSLGCFNSFAVFLGTNPHRQEEEWNVLFYRAFFSWTNNSHWTVTLDREEYPLLLALGRHWAAALTTKDRLRVFSSTGIQTEVIKVDKNVITMLGSENGKLCIVYQLNLDRCDFELFELVDMIDIDCIQLSHFGHVQQRSVRMTLPCSPSSLLWIGFRETDREFDELMAFSRTQELFMFRPYRGNSWTVVLDNSKRNSHNNTFFWPCYCYNTNLFGTVCRTGQEFPDSFPHPLLSCVILSIPLVVNSDSSYELEQQYVWDSMTLSKMTDSQCKNASELHKKLDKTLIRLFEDACLKNQLSRALDFASRLHASKAYAIACQIANHHGMGVLAQKVESLIENCPEKMQQRVTLSVEHHDHEDLPMKNCQDENVSSLNNSHDKLQESDSMDTVKEIQVSSPPTCTKERIQERKRRLQDAQTTSSLIQEPKIGRSVSIFERLSE